jgi:peptidoglycan-associated lipoprotein
MKKLVISILLVNLLAACASQKPKETMNESQPAPAAMESKDAGSAPAVMEVDPLNDPNSMLAKRSTYYPFDVSAVQDEDKPAVRAHARYLASHADRKVRLEGNCDERGSGEYNLALGQRRAEGVKQMLMAGGAMASQIETVSYGEEKPKLACHAEKCWKENRRTDLQY